MECSDLWALNIRAFERLEFFYLYMYLAIWDIPVYDWISILLSSKCYTLWRTGLSGSVQIGCTSSTLDQFNRGHPMLLSLEIDLNVIFRRPNFHTRASSGGSPPPQFLTLPRHIPPKCGVSAPPPSEPHLQKAPGEGYDLNLIYYRKSIRCSHGYTLLKSDVTRRDHVSVAMDAGSRIVNFIVNFIRDGTVFAYLWNIQHWCTCAVVTREPWNNDNGAIIVTFGL